MTIKKVMVVGSGFMGSGIAQVAAAAGFAVTMQDIKDDFVQKGLTTIEKNLKNSVTKGNLNEEEKNSILGRITPTVDLSLAKDCDVVIEVIFENKQAKTDLFKKLEEICPPQVIFASNTSSIPITELAASTKRPAKFAGMHFFSPVPVMKLVEVIRGLKTSEETAVTIKELAEKFGLAVAETLWENFKDPKWAPSLLLKKMVASGDLGRKTGQGWYDYSSGEKNPRTDLNF